MIWLRIKKEGASSVKDEVIIDARQLGHKGTIKPFDLKINKGEVIGLTGLLGSGRSELARSIYGADKPDSGELYVKGSKFHANTPLDAMMQGMGISAGGQKGRRNHCGSFCAREYHHCPSGKARYVQIAE